MRGIFLLGLSLLLLPSAVGQQVQPGIANPRQPTPTTLYFHVNGVQDMAVNTQEPDPGYEETVNWGNMPTAPCLDAVPNQSLGARYHTWYAYASPSYVEYNLSDETIRTHPERGIAYDVELDAAGNFTLYWYLLVGASSVDGRWIPAAAANLQVIATMRMGDAISIDDRQYDSGELLAQGATAPVAVAGGQVVGGAGQVRAVRQVDDAWVYEFAVPMQVQSTTIHRATGFNVRIDFQMESPICEGVMPPIVAVHTSSQAKAIGIKPRQRGLGASTAPNPAGTRRGSRPRTCRALPPPSRRPSSRWAQRKQPPALEWRPRASPWPRPSWFAGGAEGRIQDPPPRPSGPCPT